MQGNNLMKLLYTDEQGNLLTANQLNAISARGSSLFSAADYIPMPEGATLTALPGRIPLGQTDIGRVEALEQSGWAVAALLPQGFTRTMLPAYDTPKEAVPEVLPLLGYAAVAMKNGEPMVAAVQTDEHKKWHPDYYNTTDLPQRIKKVEKALPHNRIVRQLAHCSMSYGCFTAQNLFYRRWEAGLPVSQFCNARCIGCISEQESQCCPSAQGRLTFRPRVREIAEVGVYHLTSKGDDAIISFGQGCEGEPSLESERIAKALRVIRKNTEKGTVNMNTNAGHTGCIREIVDAGLDSMRVSIFSAIPDHYQAYYRPKAYSLADVENSILYGVENGVDVSLNLLTFPGFTDREEEIHALTRLIKRTGLKKVQLRNLNIDCEYFYSSMEMEKTPSLGIPALIDALEKTGVTVGSYTVPKNK